MCTMDENMFGSALILAGGKSTRMGFDKQNLDFYRDNIIRISEYFRQVIISTNTPELYRECSIENAVICSDEYSEKGPVGGLFSGLKHSDSEYCYVTACDMPYISFEYIEYMKKRIFESHGRKPEICTVMHKSGYAESMNCFYMASLWKKAEECIKENILSVRNLRSKSECIYISDDDAEYFMADRNIFLNINTCSELNEFRNSETL